MDWPCDLLQDEENNKCIRNFSGNIEEVDGIEMNLELCR
jgi:hypothetical protein